MQCVAECTNTTHFIDATLNGKAYRQCVEEDASKYYVKESVMTSSGMVEYTHYYTACPQGRQFLSSADDKECKDGCGAGQKKFYVKGDVKVCVADCPSEYPFLNGAECVIVCPAKTFLQTDGKTCGAACASRTYQTVSADSAKYDACLAENAKCPANFESVTVGSDSYAHCVGSCPNFADGKCRKTCPLDTFLNEDANTCTATCASGFYVVINAQKICVLRCAEPFVKRHRESDLLVHCYDRCPPSAPVDVDDTCMEQMCVAGEFYDMKSGSCMTLFQCSIHDGYVYSSGGYQSCLTADECAKLGAKAFARMKKCVVTDVQDSDFDRDGNVYTCRDGTYIDHLTTLVGIPARCVDPDECMLKQQRSYLYEASGICTAGVLCERTGLFFYETDDNGRTRRYCVSACPAGTFLQSDGHTCAKGCASGVFEAVSVRNATQNVCLADVSTCTYILEQALTIDSTSVRYTQCYDACPRGKFLQEDGKTCGNTCASGFYVTGKEQNTCLEDCPAQYSMQYMSGTLIRCVETCPPGIRLVGDNTCAVSECADNEFYDLGSASCMTKQKCTADGKYVYVSDGEHWCLTASECAEKGTKAFATIGACYDVNVSESDFVDEGNVYQCREAGMYNIFMKQRTLCISKEKCMTNGLYIYEAERVCTTDSHCHLNRLFTYEVDESDNAQRYCVHTCPEQIPVHNADGNCATCVGLWGKDTSKIYFDSVKDECISVCASEKYEKN